MVDVQEVLIDVFLCELPVLGTETMNILNGVCLWFLMVGTNSTI